MPSPDPIATVDQLLIRLGRALERRSWQGTIDALESIRRTAAELPPARRPGLRLALRRVLPNAALGELIEAALRAPEARPALVEVLVWLGPAAAEAVVDRLREGRVPGPHGFLLEAAGRIPEVFPLALALLVAGTSGAEMRAGAGILGRLADPRAVEPLGARISHPDPLVRGAVLEALGRIGERSPAVRLAVVGLLRRGLRDGAAEVRAEAARGLARVARRAAAMPLLAALEREREPGVRRELAAMVALLGGRD